jgi:hypothetical protein
LEKPKHVLHEAHELKVLLWALSKWRNAECCKDHSPRIWAREGLALTTIPHFLEASTMRYRCEATSVAGFIQQLAVGYVARGYHFYVVGRVPEGKDPRLLDEKLVAKYGILASKGARARRKALGYANVQYLRYKNWFVLLATPGKHEFFILEEGQIQDAREIPIKLFGYAVSYRNGHPHVRIEQRKYLELKASFADLAVHRKRERLEEEFLRLEFEPYAPVRSQLSCILRDVNRRRKTAQFELVPSSCLRTRRRIESPFENRMPLQRQPCASIEADSLIIQAAEGESIFRT